MNMFDVPYPSEIDGESNAIKYTHSDRPEHGVGLMPNHESSRTREELKSEETGNSVRDEGLTLRRKMRGEGSNNQFPWRGNHTQDY